MSALFTKNGTTIECIDVTRKTNTSPYFVVEDYVPVTRTVIGTIIYHHRGAHTEVFTKEIEMREGTKIIIRNEEGYLSRVRVYVSRNSEEIQIGSITDASGDVDFVLVQYHPSEIDSITQSYWHYIQAKTLGGRDKDENRIIISGPTSSQFPYAFYTDITKRAHMDTVFLRLSDLTESQVQYDSEQVPDWKLAYQLLHLSSVQEATDPYNQNGSSGTYGGGGSYDTYTDVGGFPVAPSYAVSNSGLISVFIPNIEQINSLASYLWSTNWTDIFVKAFADPMSAVMGLHVLPFVAPHGSAKAIKVGNLPTGVAAYTLQNQVVQLNCGSININLYTGSYMDYAPNTKIQIFLPYIGFRDLSPDDVMNETITVVYNIDILTGCLVAFIRTSKGTLYEFGGNCATPMPITNISYDTTIRSALAGISSMGSAVSGGSALQSAINTATNVMSGKPNIQHSGSIQGSCGVLGSQKPYVIITRPNKTSPLSYNHFTGYPAHITKPISALIGTGYTEFEEIRINDSLGGGTVYAKQEEISEIENLLKSGVIL